MLVQSRDRRSLPPTWHDQLPRPPVRTRQSMPMSWQERSLPPVVVPQSSTSPFRKPVVLIPVVLLIGVSLGAISFWLFTQSEQINQSNQNSESDHFLTEQNHQQSSDEISAPKPEYAKLLERCEQLPHFYKSEEDETQWHEFLDQHDQAIAASLSLSDINDKVPHRHHAALETLRMQKQIEFVYSAAFQYWQRGIIPNSEIFRTWAKKMAIPLMTFLKGKKLPVSPCDLESLKDEIKRLADGISQNMKIVEQIHEPIITDQKECQICGHDSCNMMRCPACHEATCSMCYDKWIQEKQDQFRLGHCCFCRGLLFDGKDRTTIRFPDNTDFDHICHLE